MNDQFFRGPAPVQPKSWLSRNQGLAIGLACFGLLVVGCLFVGGVVTIVATAMRSSDAYKVALSTASRDPRVIAELGAPVTPGWFTTGQINVSGSSGHANLAIPISGPHAAGRLDACADKAAGRWRFTCLTVVVPGRSAPIDLLPALAVP